MSEVPFQVFHEARQSTNIKDAYTYHTLSLEWPNKPEPAYYVAERHDRRFSNDGRELAQTRDITGFGRAQEATPFMRAFNLLLLSDELVPLSIHQSVATLGPFITKYHALRPKLGKIVEKGRVVLFDITPTEAFEEMCLFDSDTLTGIVVFSISPTERLTKGYKHHSSKTGDLPVTKPTQAILTQFDHEVPTTKRPSPYRFYLKSEGQPHSLHRDTSSMSKAIEECVTAGQQITIHNAKGQELQL